MLDAGLIKKLFRALNNELAGKDIQGEVGICGGAVMCLVFNARQSTKDIDAIFAPTAEIRKASQKVAARFGLEPDWLNDAAKGFFLTDPPKEKVLELSHLRVWAPSAEYMLAMKCVSARLDTHDKEDIEFLLKHLKLSKPDKVFTVISRYYPASRIPAKTKFLIEELLDS